MGSFLGPFGSFDGFSEMRFLLLSCRRQQPDAFLSRHPPDLWTAGLGTKGVFQGTTLCKNSFFLLFFLNQLGFFLFCFFKAIMARQSLSCR